MAVITENGALALLAYVLDGETGKLTGAGGLALAVACVEALLFTVGYLIVMSLAPVLRRLVGTAGLGAAGGRSAALLVQCGTIFGGGGAGEPAGREGGPDVGPHAEFPAAGLAGQLRVAWCQLQGLEGGAAAQLGLPLLETLALFALGVAMLAVYLRAPLRQSLAVLTARRSTRAGLILALGVLAVGVLTLATRETLSLGNFVSRKDKASFSAARMIDLVVGSPLREEFLFRAAIPSIILNRCTDNLPATMMQPSSTGPIRRNSEHIHLCPLFLKTQIRTCALRSKQTNP